MKRLVMTALSVVIVVVVALPAHAAETTLRITLQVPLASNLGRNLILYKGGVRAL
jgi:C4-dicarboxylate-binding protein DctP